MTGMSAPVNCQACGDLIRRAVDVDAHADVLITADQVGADIGHVHVVHVIEGIGLWEVAVRDRPGPPAPPEHYVEDVPPALFAVHICPLQPSTWPAAAEQLEVPA